MFCLSPGENNFKFGQPFCKIQGWEIDQTGRKIKEEDELEFKNLS